MEGVDKATPDSHDEPEVFEPEVFELGGDEPVLEPEPPVNESTIAPSPSESERRRRLLALGGQVPESPEEHNEPLVEAEIAPPEPETAESRTDSSPAEGEKRRRLFGRRASDLPDATTGAVAEESSASEPQPEGTIASSPSEGEKRRRLLALGRRGEDKPSEDAEPAAEAPPQDEATEDAVAPSPPEGAKSRGRLSFARKGGSEVPSHEEKSGGDRGKKLKKLVGLKIGASQIAAARVVNNGNPELVDVVREPLEPGLVVSGEIRDPLALADSLRRFFELHKLPKKGVRLGLSNNRIGVRVLEIEGVTDDKQLDNAIRFRAEEVLPIPLDEAVLDYVVLEEGARESGIAFRRILLVVAYREVVDRYLLACREAGLEVVGIDLEAFALLRSLVAPTDAPAGDGALVAAAVGHDRTTIAVTNGRFCEFTRVLDWGGWSLNIAIARELGMAPNEVEHLKRQLSFAEETEVEGLTPEQLLKARDAAQRALGSFARELVASLQFYQAQPGSKSIGHIVLTGGAAHMPGFVDAVGRLIGVPVRLGDPFERVKFGKHMHSVGPAGSLAVAIGLGIED
jgi:type IV pilus assembly protein PilM